MKREIFLGSYLMKSGIDPFWRGGTVYLYDRRFLIYWDHYPHYMYYDMEEIEFKFGMPENLSRYLKEGVIAEVIE
jgi:hypothetical protein